MTTSIDAHSRFPAFWRQLVRLSKQAGYVNGDVIYNVHSPSSEIYDGYFNWLNW